MQLQWTDSALGDLDDIEHYIAAENSMAVALDVVLNILDSTQSLLSSHPAAGRPGRVKHTRELVIDGIPFVVIYRIVEPAAIQVLRVLHDARQWP